MPLFDLFNLEVSHEQLFFTDGEHPSDLGFMGDGKVRPDDPSLLDQYRCKSGNYNDCLMRKAVFFVGNPPSYCLIGQNCQDWAGAVRRKYWDLTDDEWELEDCGLECAPPDPWAWIR